MAGKFKAEFVVVEEIVRGGVVRAPGYRFTACADGVRVVRWMEEGRISMPRGELTDVAAANLFAAGMRRERR